MFLGLALIALVSNSCFAESSTAGKPDKSRYWLFNPTPRDQMRELSTDRPDKTESAYTVDAGHFQFETDLIAFTYDRDSGGVINRTFAFNLINLKAGVANWSDLQVIVGGQYRVSTEAGTETRSGGVSDVTLRWKFNIHGNDGGPTASGIMPFVKLPSAQAPLGNGKVEGGVIIPFAFEGPWEIGFATMAQVNFSISDSNPNHYVPVYISSFTMGHSIVGDLAGYAEFFSQSKAESGSEWIATADFGLTWEFVKDWQADMGINIGLTPAADDWNPFLGLSARF
jgi:hypothetical protein